MGVRAVPQITTVTGTTRTFEHASSAHFTRVSAINLALYPTVTILLSHCDRSEFQQTDRCSGKKSSSNFFGAAAPRPRAGLRFLHPPPRHSPNGEVSATP